MMDTTFPIFKKLPKQSTYVKQIPTIRGKRILIV